MKQSKNRKRWFAVLLSIVFCFTLLPTTAFAASVPTIKNNTNIKTSTNNGAHKYNNNWVYWSQGASRYGGKMQSSGCRVVAQAKLLKETGIVTVPTSQFNPDTFVEWGYDHGYFGNKKSNTPFTSYIGESNAGQAAVSYASSLGKNLTFVGKKSLTKNNAKDANTVMQYLKEGYYVILCSAAHHAYVYREKSLQANTPYLADSYTNYSSTPNSIISFVGYPNTSWGKGIYFDSVRLYKVSGTTSSNTTTTKPAQTTTTTNQQLIKDGTYTLTPKSGPVTMRLDIKSGSKNNGAVAQIYTANTTAAQEFKFKFDSKTGTYTITNVNSGKVLDVKSGKAASGTVVQQWASNGTNAQKWKLVSAGNGYYYLASALNNNLVLDVKSAGTTKGTAVQICNKNSTNAQQWKIQPVSEKTYYVKNNVDGTLAINAAANTKNQIGAIPKGGAITIDTTINSGKWWYGNYNGTCGYVYSTYLQTTKPAK